MIFLGPAGNCASDTLSSLKKVKELGLTAQEIEFVYGITISNESAKKIGELNKELKLKLSIHAPYYINLAAKEKVKLNKSKHWIISSAERAHHMGAKKVIFHPGFFMGREKEEVFDIIRTSLGEVKDTINDRGFKVKLAPETTGKHSAFGDLDEILKLSKNLNISYCVDFAHLYARNNGKIDYKDILKKLDEKEVHCHFSGINYGEKGEKNHLNIDSNKPNFKELAKLLVKKKQQDFVIICESPRQYLDSLDMKKIIDKL